MTISGQYCWRMVSWILLCRWRKTSDCAAVRSHNGKVFLWRYGCYLRTARRLEQLGAPPVLPELLKSENGLILVTGATGSGKSTTLAAMVGYLNQHADAHILTLEDPVEYLYTSQRCLIQQREIGLHCMTFASGLRAALREDPDVILLGEPA